ncbi:uncharacterized protein [Elaeis guineensis]|uniref:uncharacterized protein n=1 Tax=Elaeis guineensis var. tenera TaxID=51953 RepID=UPI003C6D300E
MTAAQIGLRGPHQCSVLAQQSRTTRTQTPAIPILFAVRDHAAPFPDPPPPPPGLSAFSRHGFLPPPASTPAAAATSASASAATQSLQELCARRWTGYRANRLLQPHEPPRSIPPFLRSCGGTRPGSVPTADGGSNWWEPRRKKVKEQDFLENSQISSIDFLQTGSVSTGLGLSLDDRRVAASSGDSSLLLLPMIDEDIDREIERMDAEIDRFIKIEVSVLLGSCDTEIPIQFTGAIFSLTLVKIKPKLKDIGLWYDGLPLLS